jgi:hypothetical protein
VRLEVVTDTGVAALRVASLRDFILVAGELARLLASVAKRFRWSGVVVIIWPHPRHWLRFGRNTFHGPRGGLVFEAANLAAAVISSSWSGLPVIRVVEGMSIIAANVFRYQQGIFGQSFMRKGCLYVSITTMQHEPRPLCR